MAAVDAQHLSPAVQNCSITPMHTLTPPGRLSFKQDFDQSSPSCAELDYINIPAPTSDIRYQESNTSPLNLETSTPSSSVIGLYPQAPVFSQQGTYHPEGNSTFYPPSAPTHNIFPQVDVRPRLGATSNPSPSGMATHAHRAPLPHPSNPISTRDYYSSATPSFRRASEHNNRSPSYPIIRNHPLSPTPSPNQSFTPTYKMDSNFGSGKPQIPPLLETTTFGTLQYADGPNVGQSIKLDINGTIDKGFFQADKEWTCYRRNYFSCICSFTLTPHSPTAGIAYTQNNATRSTTINGFAMSISAVVSDSDSHVIELVQHTPKRDKGPTARPEKVRLVAKAPQSPHHGMGMYGDGMSVGSRYDHNYGPPPPGYPSEHTFERIQFKQATANNGKRRAAQQYYHLLVELWANVSTNGGEHFVKVAHRKSAKMIVRGRSPGHYQSERRGSASSGPGGSSGSLGYGASGLGSDFGAGSALLPAAYGGAYDHRQTGHYGGASRHHQQTHSHHQHQPHDMIDHPVMTTDDVKAIQEQKEYQYYPTPVCDNSQDPRQPVDMFSHATYRELPQLNSSNEPPARAKHEDSLPPPPHYPGSYFTNRCGRYEGKGSSTGYYPSMVGPTSGISMS